MIFNSKINIYQPANAFNHGEASKGYTLLSGQPLYCHLKFTGLEQMSADRKRDIRRAKMTYEHSPVALTVRDVLKIGDSYFRLVHPPLSRFGLSNRRFYEVELAEAFNVEIV